MKRKDKSVRTVSERQFAVEFGVDDAEEILHLQCRYDEQSAGVDMWRNVDVVAAMSVT